MNMISSATYARARPHREDRAFWRDSPLSAEVVYVQPLALQGHISMGRNSEI